MKTSFFMIIVAAILIAATSCKSKSQRDAKDYMDKIEKTMKENSPSNTDNQQKKATEPFSLPQGMENIVGDWQLVKLIGDHNGNHQIDAEEEKDATTALQDLLILNSNGSCEYTVARIEARYEIVTKDDGQKKLVMYDRTGTETNRGRYIISVTNDELIINRRILGGSDFEVFKRL